MWRFAAGKKPATWCVRPGLGSTLCRARVRFRDIGRWCVHRRNLGVGADPSNVRSGCSAGDVPNGGLGRFAHRHSEAVVQQPSHELPLHHGEPGDSPVQRQLRFHVCDGPELSLEKEARQEMALSTRPRMPRKSSARARWARRLLRLVDFGAPPKASARNLDARVRARARSRARRRSRGIPSSATDRIWSCVNRYRADPAPSSSCFEIS